MIENDSTKSVLIVEDEKPLALALQVKLQKAGFNAQTAHNGEDALTTLQSKSFDVILLDLLMPGMDGWDFMSALQQQSDKKTPIIVISNLSQEEDISKARQLGATDFLIKSDVSLAEIVEKVESVLG